MIKAYDRVEWNYLRAIMLKLGFRERWVNIMMDMVTSVSFSVLFNGQKLDEFKPTRGIRQGDPISPYIFLLAAEGLSCLLRDRSSSLGGIQVATSAPPVNHLLFADDSLLLFKATTEGAEEVSHLLETYALASGQRINKDKSSIFFSKGCPDGVRGAIKQILHVPNEQLNEKYLGMPSDVGISKNGAFKYLKDRLWSKIKGWMEKLLSAAGKEVLIKSVAQAIPVYSMSCFKLPRGLCQHLTSMIKAFWWGSKRGKRKPYWVSWDTMSMPKYMGGLGFRDFEIFNLALLARQAWRVLENPELLSARILKSVYFPETDFLSAQLGNHPSQNWRAVIEGRDTLKQGLIRRIGNGETTSIWNSNWIPRKENMRPIVSLVPNPPQFVLELIEPVNARWNVQLLEEVFLPYDAVAIQKIPICTRNIEDFWSWGFEKNGTFSVRSAYRMVVATKSRREDWLDERAGPSNNAVNEKSWVKLWGVLVLAKIKVFLWRLAKHSIPNEDVRKHRNMSTSDLCPVCGRQDSWRHSLLECNMARCVW